MTNPPPQPNGETIPYKSGALLHNLILFGRVLRGLGLEVNPGRMIDVVGAFDHVQIIRKSDFYYTLRSFLVKKKDDLPLFDEAFNLFWKKPHDGSIDLNLQDLLSFHDENQEEQQTLIAPPPLEPVQGEPDEAPDDEDEPQEIIELTQTYSAREVLREKDFGDLTQGELGSIKRLISQLVWQLGQRKTRRQRIGRGRVLDIRRSLRRNLRYGGELLEWNYKEPKIKPRPLVIIADISGSMERYSRLLVHFLYSLRQGLEQRVEVFVFSTRLTRITRELTNKDVDQAIDEVAQNVHDWSGGTRIGDSLKTFNFEWARRVLRGGAIVMLISDGWDRGDPALLSQEIQRLQKLCHRLVWLNPLLGSEEYEPLTRGMQACLPHIDDFLPVHNLASLEDLAEHLRRLDDERPSRRHPLPLKGAAFIGGRE